jgi:hypothetical protein
MFKNRLAGMFAVIGALGVTLSGLQPAVAHQDQGAANKRDTDAHRKTDAGFQGFERLNSQLQRNFDAFDYRAAAEAYARGMAVAADANSHLVGQWSAVFDLPVVAIHNAVLPNGKILIWDSVGDLPSEWYELHNTTRAIIWDPATGASQRYDVNTGFNIFCAGHAAMADGRQFIAGGNLNKVQDGLNALHIFDPSNTSWNYKGTMSQGARWYPSVTALANGEMLITSGGPNTPEIYNASSGVRPLVNAPLEMPLYPWLITAPGGKTIYFGPGNDLRYLDTNGAGSWEARKARDGADREYGSYAAYDIGKILVSGGGASLKSTVVVNITGGGSEVRQAGDMATGRRQHNLTSLPDGTVLATGGNSSGSYLVDLNASVYTAELWNPATGVWRTLSSAKKTRQYHSMALLLSDGRVMVGGGGICGTCYDQGYLEKNIEIFSPPYLFKPDGSGQLAPRPVIQSSPSAIAYGQTFSITTDAGRAGYQVVLMRPSSVTHSVNFDQRRIPLQLSNNNGKRGTQASAPTDPSVAPPGYYMMFVINAAGVPSVAKMVKLG